MPVLTRSLWFFLALSGAGIVLAEQAALPYLPANQFRLADYLPPPPAIDSSLQQSDLKAVLAAQAVRSSAQVSQVQQDDEWEDSVFHFARESLGAGFSVERLPLTCGFHGHPATYSMNIRPLIPR